MILISASILLIALHFYLLRPNRPAVIQTLHVALDRRPRGGGGCDDSILRPQFFSDYDPKRNPIVTDPLGPVVPDAEHCGHVVTVGREHYNHNYVQLVQGNPVILRLKNYGAEWNRVSMSVRDFRL
jgi:hypothetical protein